MAGKVYLVGAGPGDPELLTLKAVRVLARADVVLCDDLVSDAVLDFVSRGARIVHVGKRGGCRSTPQEFIERLMVAEARSGRVVVRLKGGDPMIFGRGGEECEVLRAAGIDHEVVNGITAGLAAATAAGMPLTHRDHCHGAIFVTGHEGHGPPTDWAALVRTGLPLVVYMGVARVEALQSALVDAGMAAATPVAVVERASRSGERTITTTLRAMAADVRLAHIGSPAILLIGPVASLARSGGAVDATLAPAALRGG